MGELVTTADTPLAVAIGVRAEELLQRLFEISLEPGEKTIDQIRAIEALFKISREERLVVLKEIEVARRFAVTANDMANSSNEEQRDRAAKVLEKLVNGKGREALPPDVRAALGTFTRD